MIKLFVVGYPLDIEEADLLEIFCFHGMVHSIHLLIDKVTRQHKGYGFIEMVDQAGADRAVAAINGMIVKGRKITVKLADESRVQKPRALKSNHLLSQEAREEDSAENLQKSRRPRKLVSNRFRGES
jgi:RNA recognition motif-containing protein